MLPTDQRLDSGDVAGAADRDLDPILIDAFRVRLTAAGNTQSIELLDGQLEDDVVCGPDGGFVAGLVLVKFFTAGRQMVV